MAAGRGHGWDGRGAEESLITVTGCFGKLETLIREPLGSRSVAGMSSEGGLTVMLSDGCCPMTNQGGVRSSSLQISAHSSVIKLSPHTEWLKVAWMNWGDGGRATESSFVDSPWVGISHPPNPTSAFLSFLPLFLPSSIAWTENRLGRRRIWGRKNNNGVWGWGLIRIVSTLKT